MTGRRRGLGRDGRLLRRAFLPQVRQTLLNIRAILEAGGAEPAHLVRLTWYVTDMVAYRASLKELGPIYREVLGKNFPAMALVQVMSLVEPAAMVEIEATAVVAGTGGAVNTTLFLIQCLNGLQLGVLLFLVAAGLTAGFRRHGLHQPGAWRAVHAGAPIWLSPSPRSPAISSLALPLALLAALGLGLLLEVAVFRHLYDRDHLEQVLATFGIILFLNQGREARLGRRPAERAGARDAAGFRSRSRRACSNPV